MKSQSTSRSRKDLVPEYPIDAPVSPLSFQLPNYTVATLPNGVRAFFIPDNNGSICRVNLLYLEGSASEPVQLSGVTELMLEGLRTGVKLGDHRISQEKFAILLDRFGARISADASQYRSMITLETLTSTFDDTFPLLVAMTNAPLFPESEISELKLRKQSMVSSKLDQPQTMVGMLANQLLYGDHPFARSTNGEPATIANITRADIYARWQRLIQQGNLLIAVTGKFEPATMQRKLSQAFGSQTATGSGYVIPEPTLSKPGLKIAIWDRPEAVQTNVIVMQHGPSRRVPEYFEIELLERVLFQFAGRMYKRVRAEKGLTYGIGGGFMMNVPGGPLSIRTFTATERVGEMITTIHDAIQEFLAGGATQSEMEDAKSYLSGNHPIKYERNSTLAGELLFHAWHDLPFEEIENFPKRIVQVTSKQVLEAARKYITPANWHIALLGSRKQILPQLKKLSIQHKLVEIPFPNLSV